MAFESRKSQMHPENRFRYTLHIIRAAAFSLGS